MSGETTTAETVRDVAAEHIQDVPTAPQSSQPLGECANSQPCSQQALSQQALSQQALSQQALSQQPLSQLPPTQEANSQKVDTEQQTQEDKENIDQVAADDCVNVQKRLSDHGSQQKEETSPAKKQKVLSDGAENKVPLKEQATA